MEAGSQAHSIPTSDPCNSIASEADSTQTQQSTNPFIFPTGSVKLLVTYKKKNMVGLVSADALVLASFKFRWCHWSTRFTLPSSNPIIWRLDRLSRDCWANAGNFAPSLPPPSSSLKCFARLRYTVWREGRIMVVDNVRDLDFTHEWGRALEIISFWA